MMHTMSCTMQNNACQKWVIEIYDIARYDHVH